MYAQVSFLASTTRPLRGADLTRRLMMEQVQSKDGTTIASKDGTTIAFDQLGGGLTTRLVAGAACDRSIDVPIAQELAKHFTVLNYVRRGRGDSDDGPRRLEEPRFHATGGGAGRSRHSRRAP
jgi:hypothetical protein